MTKSLEKITVIGGGLMGSGICQTIAQSGIKVNLSDVSRAALDRSSKLIHESLAKVAKKQFGESEEEQRKFIAETLSNISFIEQGDDSLWEADLVIEAIVESLEAKQQLFCQLDRVCPLDVIFCTNTSSLKISDIAGVLSQERKKRFAGLHFFNPVPQMKLVECISIPETDVTVTETLMTLCSKLRKTPVTCKDSPGFIVNRLLIPYLLEAIRMVEREDATPKDIDTAMRFGAGHPMGPLALADLIGLDTVDYIASSWQGGQGVEPAFVQAVPLLKKMISEGKLGKKTGEGFYKYN